LPLGDREWRPRANPSGGAIEGVSLNFGPFRFSSGLSPIAISENV
jgi:hypothetical protein